MSTPASPNAVVLVQGANASAIFKEIKESRQKQGQAKVFDKNAKTQVSGVSNPEIFAHSVDVKSILKLRENTSLSSQEVAIMRSHGGYVAEITFDEVTTNGQGQKASKVSILDIDHAAVNADIEAKLDTKAALKEASKPTLEPLEETDPVLSIQLEQEDRDVLERLMAGDQDTEVVLSPSDHRVLEEIDLAWSAYEAQNGITANVNLDRDFTHAEAEVLAQRMDSLAHGDTLRASSVMHSLRRQLQAAQKARENGTDPEEIKITLTGSMKRKLRNMVQSGEEQPLAVTRAQGLIHAQKEAFA